MANLATHGSLALRFYAPFCGIAVRVIGWFEVAEEAPSRSRAPRRPRKSSGVTAKPGRRGSIPTATQDRTPQGAPPLSLPPPLDPDAPDELDGAPSFAGTPAAEVDQHKRARPPRPERFRKGELVAGRYRLEARLARGGMSEVWSCVHEELRTPRAIKFLDEKTRDDGSSTLEDKARAVLERFRFEAQLSAKLGARTRNVVAVFDAGTHKGIPYLVMEYVEGPTLEKVLSGDESVLSPARLADIFDQVASALDVAHALGVVHRDLKPSNLLLARDDEDRLLVKVADFGVAKATRPGLAIQNPTATVAGLLVGSPGYMSPEQLRADGELGPQSDVWSLGVVAYEALTGWPPFSGKTIADLIVAISTRPFEKPSKLQPGLPPSLDRFFDRALAKEPADRFSSVSEMARALRAASEARSNSVAARVAIGLAVAAAIAAVIGFATTRAVRVNNERAPAAPAGGASSPAPERSASSSDPDWAAGPQATGAPAAPFASIAPEAPSPPVPASSAPPTDRAQNAMQPRSQAPLRVGPPPSSAVPPPTAVSSSPRAPAFDPAEIQ